MTMSSEFVNVNVHPEHVLIVKSMGEGWGSKGRWRGVECDTAWALLMITTLAGFNWNIPV